MNEKLDKEQYNKMNYIEKLKYLSREIGLINGEIKNTYIDYENIDYFEETCRELMEIVTIAKDDIELNKNILRDMLELSEIIPMILKHKIEYLLVLQEILNDLINDIALALPIKTNLANLFFKMAENSDEIADLLGTSPLEFRSIMEKMVENIDRVYNMVDGPRNI